MKSYDHITTLTFDVGSTLLSPYPSVASVMSHVLARFGHQVSTAELDAKMHVFDDYYSAEYAKDESLWSEEARQREMWKSGFAHVCRAVGITENLETIAQACYDEFDNARHWRLFDGVIETLTELKRRGYRLGVISNWGAGLAQLLDDIGVRHLFETVTASAAAGVHKPMPEAFLMTLEALGAQPEETAHIGDHLTADVAGSAAVGMSPILVRFDVHDDPTAQEGRASAGEVTTVTEFNQLLGLFP